MAHESIRFPVRLRCDIQEIALAPGIDIRPMQSDDVPQLLGVESVVLDEQGRLKSVVTGSDAIFSLVGPDLDRYDQFYSSNYVATVPSREEAIDSEVFNLNYLIAASSDGDGSNRHEIAVA